MRLVSRIVLGLILITSLAYNSSGQLLSVTATITDSDGQTWNNGSCGIALINSAAASYYNGTRLPVYYICTINSAGVLNASLYNTNTITPTSSLYTFNICSNTSAICSNFQIPVTGTDLSSAISSRITAPRFGAGPYSYGYLDAEVEPVPQIGGVYYNVTNLITRQWNGGSWVDGGSSNATSIQSTPVSSTAPALGQALVYSGSNYVPSSIQTLETRSLSLAKVKGQFISPGSSYTIFSATGAGNVAKITVATLWGYTYPLSYDYGQQAIITIIVDGQTYSAPLGMFLLWDGWILPGNNGIGYGYGPTILNSQFFAGKYLGINDYGSQAGGYRAINIPYKSSVSISLSVPVGLISLNFYTQVEYYSGSAPTGRYPPTENVFHMSTSDWRNSSIVANSTLTPLPTVSGQGELESIYFVSSAPGDNIAPSWLEVAPNIVADGNSWQYGGFEDLMGNFFYGSYGYSRGDEAGIARFWMSDYGSATPGDSTSVSNFSITSNVVTFTVASTAGMSAGNYVFIGGMNSGTYLNQQQLQVLSTGFTSTQFEANFTHSDVSSTIDSGTVMYHQTIWTGYRYFKDHPLLFNSSLGITWQDVNYYGSYANRAGFCIVYYTEN